MKALDFTGWLVTSTGDNVKGKCCAGYFWCAPSCRSDTSKCFEALIFPAGGVRGLPLITGGPGWNIGMVMQKACELHGPSSFAQATLLNMPLAITVASSWSDYASLPEQYGSIFFWWAPDPTFLRQSLRLRGSTSSVSVVGIQVQGPLSGSTPP